MRLKLLGIGAAALLLTAADATDAAKKDLDRLQGTWTPVNLKYDGGDIGDAAEAKFQLVIKGNKIVLTDNDDVKKEYGQFTFKLDPTTMPKSMDVTVTAGSRKDAVLEAIYDVKGDELRICVKVTGKERPAKFESPEGASVALIVLKREKP